MKRLVIICLAYCFLPTMQVAKAQKDTTTTATVSEEITRFFGPETPLDMEVVTDMKAIFRKKKDEDYFPSLLTIHTEHGDITREIGVKARGEFRRNFCSVPPLKFKFKHANFGFPEWDDLSSLKLVTTCKETETFEQYLVKEYLAYRMYQVLSPRSLRVRMVRIVFRDKSNRFEPIEQMGFFIEDIDDLAARNDAFELEPPRMSESWADRHSTTLMMVYQYAIGNTDWHVGNLHNVKVIKSNDPIRSTMFLVPYDFDFSGLVNAHYARPNESLMIPDVRTRVYQGRCTNELDLMVALEEVSAARADWEQLIRECPWLNETNRTATLDYMDEFFSMIQSERKRELAFLSNCTTADR